MKQSQGRILINALKRRGMTTMEMIHYVGSVCPWRRLAESLKANEELTSSKNNRGLNVYRVKEVK